MGSTSRKGAVAVIAATTTATATTAITLTSSNLRLSPATKSDTTTATTFTRTHPNTSAPQSSSQMQSPDWAKRIDTSTAQANTSHENDERYTGDTAVSNSYNRRKSTPLPPLPRNSPFPPCVQPSPSLAHQDASHGSPRPTNVANKQPRTSQRKATATTASSSSGAAAAAISSPIKHQLIMSDDDHEMTGAMMETPTRRPRTVRAKQASPAVTRSTRRRAAMKQRNDTDDIMSRTPGAFTTEKAPVTPAKSSRSRAYSPRKKTKTTTEQRDSISSSRRSTRARNPQTDDETMSMDASHKDVPAQLIRNGDTPWPSRVQSHTRLRGNNSSSNTGHDKFNLTKKELVSLSSMHGTPSATSTKTGTRRGHAKDAATSTDNTGNVMTESYYTPSKKPVSAMKIASSTAIDDTPRQQARMLTRSMRRAHANESETGE
ncbi:hypothetical protein BDF22DRAFT_216001 [Syncephalis plumigaleata]|nr:hypothetical protein BDF22DRAFT_216001 [Syncephalis plumigaleata]